MTSKITTLWLVLLMAPLSPFTGLAMAQEDRWYKVELLIFARVQPAALQAETWAATPALAHPTNYQFLKSPESFPIQLDLGTSAPALEPNDPQTQPDVATGPTPLALLPASDRALQAKAQQMARSDQYSVLFHQSWLQPMAEKDRAPHIVLDRSGDDQRWPELQGSIKLYLSRYLHIETNLWLNTMGAYLPSGWQMPAPPLGPPSQPAHTLVLSSADVAPEPHALNQHAELPATGADEALDSDEYTQSNNTSAYPWRHALPLQQKRRMRSSEIHYIDHPVLGVVVQITPVDNAQP